MGKIPPYWNRPAKRVQRYMLFDAMRQLRVIASPRDYQYVGFGSWEFMDFQLVRRHLGIERMVSIEKDAFRRGRYEFNRPFKDIDLRFGASNEVLQDIEWNRRSIVWLDYTSRLDHNVLQDVALLAERLPSGSALAVSVQAVPGGDDRMDRLADAVGEDRIPPGVDDVALDGWGLADVQREILTARLAAHVTRRPGTEFRQVMYTQYADLGKMMTWAGVLVDESDRAAYEAARFRELEQYRGGKRALRLMVPALSAREVLHLDDLMTAGKRPKLPGVDAADSRAYVSFHRWYPFVATPVS